MPDAHPLLLPLAFFMAAALYASVGHAGASAYLATMALLGAAPDTMKPTALVLNVCVATIATVQFGRARAVPWTLVAPFIAGATPAAFLAARLPVPPALFKLLVGLALVGAALRLAWHARAMSHAAPTRSPHVVVAVGSGALIGAFAGLTGTGGGIFLTPLVLFMRWADPRRAAGLSAAFILMNSCAGLLANPKGLGHLPPQMPYLVLAVVLGGALGSTLGVRVMSARALRLALACVLLVAAAKMLAV